MIISGTFANVSHPISFENMIIQEANHIFQKSELILSNNIRFKNFFDMDISILRLTG